MAAASDVDTLAAGQEYFRHAAAPCAALPVFYRHDDATPRRDVMILLDAATPDATMIRHG